MRFVTSITGSAHAVNTSHSSSDSSYAPANRSVRVPGGNTSGTNNPHSGNNSQHAPAKDDYDEFDF